MKNTDRTKEILKRILQVEISRQEAEKLLRSDDSGSFYIVKRDRDKGTYTVDEREGLTEEEMLDLINSNIPIIIIPWKTDIVHAFA